MKILRIIKKSFKDAFKSVFRNFSLSAASISCIAITLVLVAVALLVTYNVNSVTEKFENELTIIVMVDSNATSAEIEDLEYKINSIANVDEKKTEYTSKEDLKNNVSKKDEDMKKALAILDTNPLPNSFIVGVKNAKQITKTAKEIQKLDKVLSVKYGENIVNKVVSMFDIVRNACIFAVIALIVVTAFLIGNTIKITIFSRRNEISIMRLVGTSNTVIKLPFLIEGLILGMLGAILPILITIYGYIFIYDYVGGNMFSNLVILVKPSEIVYEISLVLLLIGGIVGMFGSVRAVKRYLKV